MGNKVETQIIKLVKENDTLMKLGLAFEFPETRVKVTEKLQDNNDQSKLNLFYILIPCKQIFKARR